MRDVAWRVALAVAAIALCIVSAVAARAATDWALAGASVPALVVELTAGAGLVLAGIVVWVCGPDARSGQLLTAAGLLRLVAEWNNPDGAAGALVFTLGLTLTAAAAAPLAHALVVHGDGQLTGWRPRLAVLSVYAGALLIGPASTLFSDPSVEGCSGCPANLLRIVTAPRLEAGLERWGVAVLAAALIVAAVLAVSRLWRRGPHRRIVAPVVIPGSVALLLAAADLVHSWQRGFVSNDPLDRRLWLLQAVAIWLMAGGVAWQRLQTRRLRAAVAGVAVELGDAARPGGLRDALAETLGDPQLELLHAHGDGWIDGQGLARRPEGAAVTELTRDGRAVAVLVHRPGLLDDSRLVRELERTAGLALENDRLHGELEAQLAQLRDSRAETVAVGDAERRRLERDLHDGAQQALAGLAMSFGLARADAMEPSREQRLGVAQDAVRAALAELRALAQRISPAALSEAGLATALGVLAEWAPNLEIARVPRQRFNPTVESAAYFAVAGLTRTTRGRILVDARVEGASLRLDVLAAEAPSSLVDIEDRVAALDGDLLAEDASNGATLLRITLPCAS